MQFHILDENYTPVAVMDNNLPETIHFSKSKFQRFLTGSADFFDFETSKLHVDAELFQVGYWIAFKYNNRDHLLYITQIDEAERDQMMSISSMSLNLDLNLETTLPFSASAAQPFSWYFNQIMYDTGYEIGVNEISNLTRKLSWESEMSHRAFLQSVATQFDNAELDYEVKLNSDFTIKKRLVHIKKKIGEVRDDIELRYGKNVKTIKRSTDISSICTAVRPMSKDANEKITTISSLANWQTLDDNGNVQFFHTKGENFVKAPQANARFGNRGSNVNGGGYIVYNFSHDKISQSELFNRARAYLEEHSVPVINYEVEGRTGANIGDTVKIVDDGYTPQLILSARVLEQIVSFDDATVEAATFGNYRALQSQISADLIAKMQQLAEENAPYKTVTLTTNGLTFKNSAGSTILTARLYKGNKEITPEKIEWMIDGVSLSGSTNKREINANDVDGKTVVRWSAVVNDSIVAFDEVTIVDVSDGIAGADGRGVVEIKSKWQVTNSSTPPSETWGNGKWQSVLQVPTVTNKYLWQHDRTIFTDGTTSDAITLSAVYGDKGDNGAKGDKGDTGATGSAGAKGNDGTNGADAWSVIMTNENVTLPANAQGGVLSYANSGTSISVVYGTGAAFTPVISSATLANNQFKVSASASNITAGTQTVDAANQKTNYAATSAMSATTGAVASITYTISIRNNAGVTSTVTKVQNFTKAEKGITGDKGVDSYTYIRYSASSNGASMTSLPNADSQYIGTCTTTQATAPSAAASYTWAKFAGEKGDPTGITKSSKEPTTRFAGMMWYVDSTSDATSSNMETGTVAQSHATYVWNGSKWSPYILRSVNMQMDNGFITNAMIANAAIDNAKIANLNANKITAGELLTSRLRPTSVNLLRNTEFLELSNADVTGWNKRFNSGNPNSNRNTLYYSSVSAYGHISLGFSQTADTSLWGDNDWGELYQDVKAMANTSYTAHVMIRGSTATKDNGRFSLRVECLNSSGVVISAPTISTAANAPGIINGSQVVSDGYFGNRTCLASTSNTAWNTVTGTGEYSMKDVTWRQLATAFITPAGTTKIRYILHYQGNGNYYASMPMLVTGSAYVEYVSNSLVVDGDIIVKGSIKAEHMTVNSLSAITANLGDITAGSYTSWEAEDYEVYDYLNGIYMVNGHIRTISIENPSTTNPNTALKSGTYTIRGTDSYSGALVFYQNQLATSATPNSLLTGNAFFTATNQTASLSSYKYSNGTGQLSIQANETRIVGDLSIGSENISAKRSKTVSLNYGMTAEFRRRGNLVHVIFPRQVKTISATSEDGKANETIPVGYRPAARTEFNINRNTGSNVQASLLYSFLPTGEVRCTNSVTAQAMYSGSTMYFTDDPMPS